MGTLGGLFFVLLLIKEISLTLRQLVVVMNFKDHVPGFYFPPNTFI
jgi:hypothetical protein